jgi:hypothetical protein
MTLGADIDDYRRDLCVLAKKQLPEGHKLRTVQYRKLADEAHQAAARTQNFVKVIRDPRLGGNTRGTLG